MSAVLALVLSSANAADCTATQAVEAFAAAADTRNAAALESLLHPDFRVVFSMKGSSEASLLSRSVWFSMFNEGKIGGVPRSLTVVSATPDRGLSVVVAALDGASGRFESTYTVVRDAAGCRILQDAVLYTPPAAK